MVTLQLCQINVPPGQRVEFSDVPWFAFETMLIGLGDHRSSRIAYSNGTLEIMPPSPEHEISQELIGDMAKILFDEPMMGKDRINLEIDPPPDLAIEIDVTSKTKLDAYEKLGVLEL